MVIMQVLKTGDCEKDNYHECRWYNAGDQWVGVHINKKAHRTVYSEYLDMGAVALGATPRAVPPGPTANNAGEGARNHDPDAVRTRRKKKELVPCTVNKNEQR